MGKNRSLINKATKKRAVVLHRYMLQHEGTKYAIPRLFLALDLATIRMAGMHNQGEYNDREAAAQRVKRFVELNP